MRTSAMENVPVMTRAMPMSVAPAPRPLRRGPWVRDFAVVGAATGFLAPAVFFLDADFLYPLVTGTGGAAAGVLAGVVTHKLMSGRMRRMQRLWLFPLGMLIGLVWGALAGAAPGLVGMRASMLFISAIVAGIAGMIQLGWFWFAYCVRRVNHRSTWPVVLAACGTAAGVGFAAVAAFTGL